MVRGSSRDSPPGPQRFSPAVVKRLGLEKQDGKCVAESNAVKLSNGVASKIKDRHDLQCRGGNALNWGEKILLCFKEAEYYSFCLLKQGLSGL